MRPFEKGLPLSLSNGALFLAENDERIRISNCITGFREAGHDHLAPFSGRLVVQVVLL